MDGMSMQESLYNHCVELSRIGDWDSLNELMAIYQSAQDSQTKKDARKALRKAKNRKAVMAIIHNAINNAASNEERLDLLFTGLLFHRVRFLYDYLVEVHTLKGKIQKKTIEEMTDVSPFTNEEMDELVRYILEKDDYSVIIFRKLDSEHKNTIINNIKDNISNGKVSGQMLTIISEDEKFLLDSQESIKKYLSSNPEDYYKVLPFVKLEASTDASFFEQQDDLFAIYRALAQNKWDITKLDSSNEYVKVAKAIISGDKLSDEQWILIRTQIGKTVSSATDIDRLDVSFYLFLRGLAKIDGSYAETIYIDLYEKTGLYSNRILSEMTEMSIPYAYRILTNRLLTIENDAIRRKTIAKLLKHFNKSALDTYQHVLQLNNKGLIRFFNEKAEQYGISLNSELSSIDDIITEQTYRLLDRSIIISDLMVRIAKEIKAVHFYAAVGFAYTSGLRMLKPILDEVNENGGISELIIGSLQNYGHGGKNTKIDKTTVEYLYSLIKHERMKLFTYQNSFYHGKYYYIANETVAYIIVGSSNISKTAYLSNYELDSYFKVSRKSTEDKGFLDWYYGFRYECYPLEELNEDEFENFNWNDEQHAFGGRRIIQVTKNEVAQRINQLTDDETKKRLNMWLAHNPTEILSNLDIPALSEYIAFLYSDNGLAVFESFVAGNAFYSFRYDDFEHLLTQISKLTKTEMLVASNFLMRGYHIQDHDKLENKINRLLGISFFNEI